MAIVQFTAIVNEIRGKLNGSVFNRARTVSTLQGKQMPPKKRTGKQSEYRNTFAQVQRAWKTLTPVEQQTFADAADMFPVRNRFGELVHISGYNWFIRTNLLRLSVDLDLLRSANTSASGATAYDQYTVLNAELQELPGGNRIEVDVRARVSEGAIIGNSYIAYVSRPVSPGQTAFYGNWIVAGFGLIPGFTSPGDFQNFIVSRATSAIGHTYRKGDHVFVRFLVVATQNGATYQDIVFRVQLT